ncbi:hypothetical protein [Streptococcus sp. AM28-20]|uniref:hypothetical protein n=1 Tax=Streptococcus sp. AM28-20 TaxID=2293246 RepID=UPI001FB2533A|nr:hypothetical protein [Streptococcus sp. AM28-20]
MKNSKRFYLYIFIIATLYAIQFYINNKITPVGDQTAFLNMQKNINIIISILELTAILHGVADY